MSNKLGAITAVVLLSVACAAQAAQTCRNDITPSAPNSRFTDHGNGTISDAATGLMWKKCAEGLGGAGCLSGTAASIGWIDALPLASAADFANYTDWRLPNKNELESLVERRCYDPAINATYFPNTPSSGGWSSGFWSSSPIVYSMYRAWCVDFSDGVFCSQLQRDAKVRLVRGGE